MFNSFRQRAITATASAGMLALVTNRIIVHSSKYADLKLQTQPVSAIGDIPLKDNMLLKITTPSGKENYLVGLTPKSVLSTELRWLLDRKQTKVYLQSDYLRRKPVNYFTVYNDLLKLQAPKNQSIDDLLCFTPEGYLIRGILLQSAVDKSRTLFTNAEQLEQMPTDLSSTIGKMSIFDVLLLSLKPTIPENIPLIAQILEHARNNPKHQTSLINKKLILSRAYQATGNIIENFIINFNNKRKEQKQHLILDNDDSSSAKKIVALYNAYENISRLKVALAFLFVIDRPLLSKKHKEAIKIAYDMFEKSQTDDDLLLYAAYFTEQFPEYLGSYPADFYQNYCLQLFYDLEPKLNDGECIVILNWPAIFSKYGMLNTMQKMGYKFELVEETFASSLVIEDEKSHNEQHKNKP